MTGTTAASRPVEQPLWRALAAATAPLTLDELARRSGADRRAIRHRLACWTNAGLAARIDPTRYALTDAADRSASPPRTTYQGAIRPRERTDRDRLWTAMRVLRAFDAPALRMAADATERSVATYLNALQRGGYVRMTRRGSAKNGIWATYVLVRNSGRLAPRISHATGATILTDRNTGARIDISPGAASLRNTASDTLADGGVS